ncbi:hypothetical protein Scep_015110 [Stephania cephalantha]|uniref:O-methyltransferase C-terminal domain-containing protein n=1 Tax=Stephania cephalantha TaxID=152367 RepID=A0AAP0P149_9MAGN
MILIDLMQWILHDWPDETCIKLLKNCRKAIPERGKVVIVDAVLQPESESMYEHTRVAFDLLMLAHAPSGKERSELEWKQIFYASGFPRYNIIEMPTLQYIIEAFPN